MIDFSQLIQLRALFRQHHVLADAGQHVWVFNETLHNGLVLFYTLDGQSGTLQARLSASVQCASENGTLSVRLQDLVVGRPNHGVGTWMMNRLIAFLEALNRIAPVQTIMGDYSVIDEWSDERRRRRNWFFQRFGFVNETPGTKQCISVNFQALRPVSKTTIRTIPVDEALREWSADRNWIAQPLP